MPDNDVDAATITIPDLLSAIKDDNFTLAGNQFNDLVNDKLQNSLNQNRIRLASQIFNGEDLPVDNEEEIEDEELELELEDEELEGEEFDSDEEFDEDEVEN